MTRPVQRRTVLAMAGGTAVLRRQRCVPSSAGQMAGAVTVGAGGGEDE